MMPMIRRDMASLPDNARCRMRYTELMRCSMRLSRVHAYRPNAGWDLVKTTASSSS
jgi:hypothetical protein